MNGFLDHGECNFYIFGVQNATYELAVAITEYFGLSSAAVIASGCIDSSSATFPSIPATFASDFILLLNTITWPSVLPLRI